MRTATIERPDAASRAAEAAQTSFASALCRLLATADELEHGGLGAPSRPVTAPAPPSHEGRTGGTTVGRRVVRGAATGARVSAVLTSLAVCAGMAAMQLLPDPPRPTLSGLGPSTAGVHDAGDTGR